MITIILLITLILLTIVSISLLFAFRPKENNDQKELFFQNHKSPGINTKI